MGRWCSADGELRLDDLSDSGALTPATEQAVSLPRRPRCQAGAKHGRFEVAITIRVKTAAVGIPLKGVTRSALERSGAGISRSD